MFEFRLRVLDAGDGSFIGVVEGYPEILVAGTSASQTEADLTRALAELLERGRDLEATRLQLEDFPTVREFRLYLSPKTL